MKKNNLPTIDVVIPVAPKDYEKLGLCIEHLVAHSQNPIRNIYVISANTTGLENLSVNIQVLWVNESQYPFTKQDIEAQLTNAEGVYLPISWYYQQMLKFYIFRVIPEILPNVLVLDSDCVFVKEIQFITDDGKVFLASGCLVNSIKHKNLAGMVEFSKRLITDWDMMDSNSGVAHHMLFQKDILEEIFFLIEGTHQQPLWQAFVSQINAEACFPSEYAIYYHFALQKYNNQVTTRYLKTCEISYDSHSNNRDSKALALKIASEIRETSSEFEMVVCHDNITLREMLQKALYLPEFKKYVLSLEKFIIKKIYDGKGGVQIFILNEKDEFVSLDELRDKGIS